MSVPLERAEDTIDPEVINVPDRLSRSRILHRAISFFALALVVGTWRLWVPHTSFPQVPLFGWAIHAPFWIDWLLLVVCIICLFLVFVGRLSLHWNSAAWLISSAMMFGLMVLNQHRMQPWAYLTVLSGLLLGACTVPQSVRWLRWLVVSVYFYSAMSKFDYLFVTTLGQEFLQTGFGLFEISFQSWPATLRQWITLSLPMGELLVAVLLMISRLRRSGVVLGIVLHLLLLLILGPWGMNHRPGVLIWNLQFCVLLVLLFWPTGDQPMVSDEPTEPERPPWGTALASVARGIAMLALLCPLLDGVERWDHWLSWGLYSTRAPRVELYLSEHLVPGLPADLRQHSSHATYSGYLRKFALDRWSLAELGVPIYPQDRFHTGLCLALIQSYELDAVVAVHSSSPSRLTGQRQQERWTGNREILDAASGFWFNARPRQGFIGPRRTTSDDGVQ